MTRPDDAPPPRPTLLTWLALAGALIGSACSSSPPVVDASSDAAEGSVDAADVALPDATPDPLAGLPDCTESVLASFTDAALQSPAPNSNSYLVPAETALTALRASVARAVAADPSAALTQATAAGYTLCRGRGDEATLALWRPATAGQGQAVFAWRAADARPIAVQAPHPIFEADTVAESVAIFTRTRARVVLAAGTHRCANPNPAGCDGTTDVCGVAAEPYRESDMAHVENSAFHAAHVAFSEAFTQDVILALHGMSAEGVSVSDGTDRPTDGTRPASRVAQALAGAFTGVTSCNDGAGVPLRYHLCGTTDVQARQLNGSPAACTMAAMNASGRFIHLEQSRLVRGRMDEVAAAIDGALP